MSHYIYYEFQTIDRRLSEAEQTEISKLSSRVQLTPTRAAFVYNYSDLPASSERLVLQYFDAMLSVANWGTTQLMFRFPKDLLDLDYIEAYIVENFIECTVTMDYAVLNIHFHDDDGGYWIEEDPQLAKPVPDAG